MEILFLVNLINVNIVQYVTKFLLYLFALNVLAIQKFMMKVKEKNIHAMFVILC